MADKSCGRLAGAMLIALPILAGVAIWSGLYDVGADVPHWPLTERFLALVRERSMAVRAQGIAVPQDLGRPERITRGAGLYAEMCTGCHLAPGMDDSEMRRGLYPKPPRFATGGVDDPAEAFWAIKHGVKMTAMPAWGPSHTDAQIWDMVAFLQRLKGMSAPEYEKRLAAAPAEDDHEHGHNSVHHH